MKKVLYIHGLGSSKESGTGKYLKEHLKDCNVLTPEIPIDPLEASEFVKNIMWNEKPDVVIGSSLGGFYTMIVQTYPYTTKVLINPAMTPSKDIKERIGMGKHEYLKKRENGDKEYVIDDKFISKLELLEDMFYNVAFEYGEYDYNTYAVFGSDDELFSHINDYDKWFNKDHKMVIPMKHRPSDDEMECIVQYMKEIELL